MSILLTMVGKDVRRLKWMVGLLLAVTAVKFGIGWWLMFGATRDFATWKQLSQVVVGLVVADGVLMWLITGAMVLEDPLVGAQAAWRTRPISVTRLLIAKVVGVLLVGWGPSLVLGLPWWVASGFGVGDGLQAAAIGLVAALAVIVPSFLIAVLVDSMGRYVLWSIVGYAGAIMVPLVTNMIAGYFPRGDERWVVVGVASALAVVGWVVRFGDALQRRVFRGVTLGTAALVAVAGWWLLTNRGVMPVERWTEEHGEKAEAVRLTWRESTMVDAARREKGATVSSMLGVEGVPSGCGIDVTATEHVWTWAGGRQIAQDGYGYPVGMRWVREAFKLSPEKDDAETEAWQAVRQKEPDLKPKFLSPLGRQRSDNEPTLLARAQVERAAGDKLRGVTPSLVVKAQLRVVEPVQWLDVPLQAGARQAGGGRSVQVKEVNTVPRGDVVAWIVDTRGLPGNFFSEYQLGRWRRPNYYGVDRESGRLTYASADDSVSVWIGGVEVQAHQFSFSAPRVIREGNWTVRDAQWLERTRLVLLRWDEVARVTREARTEKFVVAK